MCLATNSKQALLCPYRDEIKEIVKSLPRIEKKLTAVHEGLYVKKNGDPLAVEIERNTEFREKVEAEGIFKKRNKWSRYRFWLALGGISIVIIFNTIMIIIRVFIFFLIIVTPFDHLLRS